MSELVSRIIEDAEICIRCIVSPLFVKDSKCKLKREAFLPPPDKKEVSLLRLRYTNLNRCKQHAINLSVRNNKYWGLSSITKSDVNSTYQSKLTDDEKKEISVTIEYAPISDKNEYISDGIDVYSDDTGLPMHADLVYNTKAKINEVQTQMRKFANELIKVAKVQKDEEQSQQEWTMGEFYNY